MSPVTERRRGAPPRLVTLVLLVAAVALVVVAAVLAHTAWRATQVVGHLDDAADRVPALTASLTTFDVDAAGATATAMRTDTAAAVALTRGRAWRLLERFPYGGQNLAAASAGARAADALATGGAGGAVAAVTSALGARDAALSLDLAGAREEADRARASAASALASAAAARGEIDGLDRRYLLPPAASALDRVEQASADVEALEQGLADPSGALGGD